MAGACRRHCPLRGVCCKVSPRESQPYERTAKVSDCYVSDAAGTSVRSSTRMPSNSPTSPLTSTPASPNR